MSLNQNSPTNSLKNPTNNLNQPDENSREEGEYESDEEFTRVHTVKSNSGASNQPTLPTDFVQSAAGLFKSSPKSTVKDEPAIDEVGNQQNVDIKALLEKVDKNVCLKRPNQSNSIEREQRKLKDSNRIPPRIFTKPLQLDNCNFSVNLLGDKNVGTEEIRSFDEKFSYKQLNDKLLKKEVSLKRRKTTGNQDVFCDETTKKTIRDSNSFEDAFAVFDIAEEINKNEKSWFPEGEMLNDDELNCILGEEGISMSDFPATLDDALLDPITFDDQGKKIITNYL